MASYAAIYLWLLCLPGMVRGFTVVRGPSAWCTRRMGSLSEETDATQLAQVTEVREGEGKGPKVADLVKAYLSQALEQSRSKVATGPEMEAASAHFVNDLRARGAKLVEAIPQLPSSKDEAWKYTSLKTLFQHSYTAAATSAKVGGNAGVADADLFLDGTLETHIDERCRRSCLVFIDGLYSPQHSCIDALKASPASSKVTFSSLGQLKDAGGRMLEQQRVLIEQALLVDRDELPRNSFASDTLTSLNLANTLDAAVLAVPAGVSVDVPLQVVFYTSALAMAQRQAQHPKLLIDVKEGSRVEIKQTYVGAGCGPVVAGTGAKAGVGAKTGAVLGEQIVAGPGAEAEKGAGAGAGAVVIGLTRVNVGARSHVVHSYEQDLPLGAKHLEVVSAEVEGDASYGIGLAQLGARLGRINIHIQANAPHANCSINSVLLAHSRQSLDIHSSILHNDKEQISRQQQRNVIGEQGEAIFKGRIRIPKIAQKTDSEQLCRSLMLGQRARVIAMPTLEITADDVTCSHGASVTDLDENSMFYLAARGVDRREARKLLLRGFVLDVLVGNGSLLDKRAVERIIDKLTSMNPSADDDVVGGAMKGRERGGEQLVQKLVSM